MKKKNQLWGGRFREDASDLLRKLNDSFRFDWQLLGEDIEGSIAWTESLVESGVLSRVEAKKIVKALGEISASADPLPIDEYEDVHSYVEAKLGEKVGGLAGKLHTGRSRNDQVATDLKLYLKNATAEAKKLALDLASALAGRAAREASTIMPGYTHLKQAEPIAFGHWCLAYVEMLLRDASRFNDAGARGDESPLGSGALAGTPLDLDREALAKRLGFARATANSLDAVSDRDFAAEYLFAATLLLNHLSRLAEDLIFFSSDEVRFVELPDSLSTGSSRMPQKKNPDVLELARGHAGRAIGELAGLLAVMKGLPLAYDKDLQLDKEPLFRIRATIALVLPPLGAIVSELELDRERMKQLVSSDLLLATAVADAIAARGVPFREAHEIVGKQIAVGKPLADLQPVAVETLLATKRALGGTAPKMVKKAAEAAKKRIEQARTAR